MKAKKRRKREKRIELVLDVLRANTYPPTPLPAREVAIQVVYALDHGESYCGEGEREDHYAGDQLSNEQRARLRAVWE